MIETKDIDLLTLYKSIPIPKYVYFYIIRKPTYIIQPELSLDLPREIVGIIQYITFYPIIDTNIYSPKLKDKREVRSVNFECLVDTHKIYKKNQKYRRKLSTKIGISDKIVFYDTWEEVSSNHFGILL